MVSATTRISGIAFNIAHSNSLIVVSITRGTSLGVDREHSRGLSMPADFQSSQ